jgi:hypothetical protein
MMFDPLYTDDCTSSALAVIAQLLVKFTFSKYSKIRSYSGMTGAQAAERMMRSNGIYDVQVEETSGFLSDHYDPSKKVASSLAGCLSAQTRWQPSVLPAMKLDTLYRCAGLFSPCRPHHTRPVTQFSSQFAYLVFFLALPSYA